MPAYLALALLALSSKTSLSAPSQGTNQASESQECFTHRNLVPNIHACAQVPLSSCSATMVLDNTGGSIMCLSQDEKCIDGLHCPSPPQAPSPSSSQAKPPIATVIAQQATTATTCHWPIPPQGGNCKAIKDKSQCLSSYTVGGLNPVAAQMSMFACSWKNGSCYHDWASQGDYCPLLECPTGYLPNPHAQVTQCEQIQTEADCTQYLLPQAPRPFQTYKASLACEWNPKAQCCQAYAYCQGGEITPNLPQPPSSSIPFFDRAPSNVYQI